MNKIFEDGILEVLKSPLNKLVKEVGAELHQVVSNRLLEYQVEEYKRNNFVKTVLFGNDPKPLYDVYQNLHLRKPNKRKAILSDTIKNVFKTEKFLTILGDAGSGKSMLLKHLFINAVKENYRYPIKVELRYLNEKDLTLSDFIINNYFKFHELAENDRIISRLLHSGRFVFFFDGYDEIKISKKESITRQLDEFIKKYNKNRYIITSRLNTGIENFPMFHNYYIQAFKETEIEEFIKKQLKENTELANDIIQSLAKEENKAYKSYLHNPLLLTMFILSYNNYSDLPPKRSIFYRQVFDTLFIIHDSRTKFAFKRERVSGLSKDKFEEALKILSFISYFEYKMLFSKEDIHNLFNTIKKVKKDIKFDNENLLHDLTISVGLMTKEGLDYSFSHRSLQEYFAASYISTLREENKRLIYEKLNKKLLEERFVWVEYYSNFYLLLSELDPKYMTKEFLIPLLKYLIQTINEDEIKEIQLKGNLSKFFLSKSWLLGLFFESKNNFQLLKKRQGKLYAKVSDLNIKFQTSNSSKTKQVLAKEINSIENEEIRPLLKDYLEYISTFISKKDDEIKNDNQSDFEILNMIE